VGAHPPELYWFTRLGTQLGSINLQLAETIHHGFTLFIYRKKFFISTAAAEGHHQNRQDNKTNDPYLHSNTF
jgi:hypothetical protein